MAVRVQLPSRVQELRKSLQRCDGFFCFRELKEKEQEEEQEDSAAMMLALGVQRQDNNPNVLKSIYYHYTNSYNSVYLIFLHKRNRSASSLCISSLLASSYPRSYFSAVSLLIINS